MCRPPDAHTLTRAFFTKRYISFLPKISGRYARREAHFGLARIRLQVRPTPMLRLSGLLYVPKHDIGGVKHARNFASPGIGRVILPGEDRRQRCPDSTGQGFQPSLPAGAVGLSHIVEAQAFDGGITRPAEVAGVCAGGVNIKVCGWGRQGHAADGRVDQIPPTSVRSVSADPAGDQSRKVRQLIIHVGADRTQVRHRHVGQHSLSREVVSADNNNLLTVVAGFSKELFRAGKIFLFIGSRAHFRSVRASANEVGKAGLPPVLGAVSHHVVRLLDD